MVWKMMDSSAPLSSPAVTHPSWSERSQASITRKFTECQCNACLRGISGAAASPLPRGRRMIRRVLHADLFLMRKNALEFLRK